MMTERDNNTQSLEDFSPREHSDLLPTPKEGKSRWEVCFLGIHPRAVLTDTEETIHRDDKVRLAVS